MSLLHQTLSHRLKRGLGAQGFGQVVNLLIRLAEVPLFLAYWGVQRYGEWLILAAIPIYLAMADGGFTGATQREMTMRMGAGDQRGAQEVFQSTWLLLLLVSVAMLLLTLLLVGTLPLLQWLHLHGMSRAELQAVLMLLVLHIVVGFQCGLVYGGYSCVGQYARGTWWVSLMYLLDFVGLALAVACGGGVVQAAAGYLGGRIVAYLLMLWDLPHVAPWVRHGVQHASWHTMRSLLKPSLASMAFPLGEALNNQGMRLVVGLMLGPVSLTVFSSVRTLCKSAMRPALVIARLMEPEMALAYGSGNHTLIRSLFKKSSQITLWVGFAVCAVLWFASPTIFELWTGGKISFDVPLFTTLLLASLVNSLWFSALMVPYATNRHGSIALIFSLVNAGMLLLTGALVLWLGVLGAGIVTLLAEVGMAVAVLRIAFVLTGVKPVDWIKFLVFPFTAVVKGVTGKRL